MLLKTRWHQHFCITIKNRSDILILTIFTKINSISSQEMRYWWETKGHLIGVKTKALSNTEYTLHIIVHEKVADYIRLYKNRSAAWVYIAIDGCKYRLLMSVFIFQWPITKVCYQNGSNRGNEPLAAFTSRYVRLCF